MFWNNSIKEYDNYLYAKNTKNQKKKIEQMYYYSLLPNYYSQL